MLRVEDVNLLVLHVRWQRYCSVQRRGRESERCSESDDDDWTAFSPVSSGRTTDTRVGA
jgi:hypothetical protein